MPSLDEVKSPRELAVDRVAQEIAKAENDRIPTSRQKLSQLVFSQFGIPLAEAANLVDQYCDEKAPGVPFYLSDEFESPFLKVMAITSSILGIGVLYYAAHQWRQQKPSWFLFITAAVFLSAASYSWFKTLRKELAEGPQDS